MFSAALEIVLTVAYREATSSRKCAPPALPAPVPRRKAGKRPRLRLSLPLALAASTDAVGRHMPGAICAGDQVGLRGSQSRNSPRRIAAPVFRLRLASPRSRDWGGQRQRCAAARLSRVTRYIGKPEPRPQRLSTVSSIRN